MDYSKHCRLMPEKWQAKNLWKRRNKSSYASFSQKEGHVETHICKYSFIKYLSRRQMKTNNGVDEVNGRLDVTHLFDSPVIDRPSSGDFSGVNWLTASELTEVVVFAGDEVDAVEEDDAVELVLHSPTLVRRLYSSKSCAYLHYCEIMSEDRRGTRLYHIDSGQMKKKHSKAAPLFQIKAWAISHWLDGKLHSLKNTVMSSERIEKSNPRGLTMATEIKNGSKSRMTFYYHTS